MATVDQWAIRDKGLQPSRLGWLVRAVRLPFWLVYRPYIVDLHERIEQLSRANDLLRTDAEAVRMDLMAMQRRLAEFEETELARSCPRSAPNQHGGGASPTV